MPTELKLECVGTCSGGEISVDLRGELEAVVRKTLPWQDVSSEDLSFRILSGGITNALYRISRPTTTTAASTPTTPSIAVAGHTSTSNSHDSSNSCETSLPTAEYTASRAEPLVSVFSNGSPQCHASSANGAGTKTNGIVPSSSSSKGVNYSQNSVIVRVYGDDTHRVIDREREAIVNEVTNSHGFGKPTLSTFIGGRVEGFIPGRPLDPEEMLQPKIHPLIAARMAEFHAIDDADSHPKLPREPVLWPWIEQWLKQALAVEFDSPERRQVYDSLRLDEVAHEVAQLKAKLAKAVDSPTVFAHNDLLSGNVIYDENAPSSKKINFIDFEYGSFNYRGFDIANHFNECCGFECDWSRYPAREHQYAFLRSYLVSDSGNSRKPDEISDEELAKFYHEVNSFTLCSHLFWGTWAVIQAKFSKIDFDYLSYARDRLVLGYFAQREKYFAVIDSAC